jgi:hypothetical protein
MSQGAGFNYEIVQHMHQPLMVVLAQPCGSFSSPLCFVRVHEKNKSCNLNPGFCRSHQEFNSGTKGLMLE